MENKNSPTCEVGEKSESLQPHLPIIIKSEKPKQNTVNPTNKTSQITSDAPTFQTVVPLNIKREIEEKDAQKNTPQPHKPIIEVKKEASAKPAVVAEKSDKSNPTSTTANNEHVAPPALNNELDSITTDCLEHLDSYIDAISSDVVSEKVLSPQLENLDIALKAKAKKESNSDDEEREPQSTVFTDDFFSDLYTPIENNVGQQYVDEVTAQIEQQIEQSRVAVQSCVDQVEPVNKEAFNKQIQSSTEVDKNANIDLLAEQSDDDLIAQKMLIQKELEMHKEKSHKHKKSKKKSKKRRRKSDSSDDDSNCHRNKRSYSTEINSPVMIHIKEEPLYERRQRQETSVERNRNTETNLHSSSHSYVSSKQLKTVFEKNYCERKHDLECLNVNPLFITKGNNLGFKPIKLEKLRQEPAKKPLTMQELKPQVKRLCAQINKVMKLSKSNKNTSDGLLAARTMEKINLEEKDLVNRSLLALNPATRYSFNNSSTYIDYRKIGLEVLQPTTARLVTLLGYDMRRLKERIMENHKRLGKNPIDLSDKTADAYSFLKDASTQTNVTDKTGISIGVQATASAFNISTQTDSNNRFPLMNNFPMLNDNQISAVNNFVELLLERTMGALPQHQTMQRLYEIYNSTEVIANQRIQTMNRSRDPRNQTMPYIDTAQNNSYISTSAQTYNYMPMSDQCTQPPVSPHYNQSPDHYPQAQRPHYPQYEQQPNRNFQQFYTRGNQMHR